MTQFMPPFQNANAGERAEGLSMRPGPQSEQAHPDVVVGQDGQHSAEVLGHDSQYYQEQFGLSIGEVSQTVNYNGKEATLAEVLVQHKDCPLGGWVREAYAEGGREAVTEKFEFMGKLSKDFVVVLDESSPEVEQAVPNPAKDPKKKLNPPTL